MLLTAFNEDIGDKRSATRVAKSAREATECSAGFGGGGGVESRFSSLPILTHHQRGPDLFSIHVPIAPCRISPDIKELLSTFILS